MNTAVRQNLVEWAMKACTEDGWHSLQWKEWLEYKGYKVRHGSHESIISGITDHWGAIVYNGMDIYSCTVDEVNFQRPWNNCAELNIILQNFFPCKITTLKGLLGMITREGFEMSCSGHDLLWRLACINTHTGDWSQSKRNQYDRNIEYLEEFFGEVYPG